MKLFSKKVKQSAFILLFALGFLTNATAQTFDPNTAIAGPGSINGAPVVPDGGPVVPFDGGLSLILLASGISYSSKRLKKQFAVVADEVAN